MSRIRKRIFQAWFRFSRPKTLGVRALVENKDGKIVLVRHTYVKGLFLPGGGIESGETALDALRKELREEAGIELLTSPRPIQIYSNEQSFRNDHVVFYHLKSSDWQPCSPHHRGEIAEILWVSPDFLPEGTTKSTKKRLAEIYSNQAINPFW